MTNLSHAASFHSNERIAPSNPGIKHLAKRRSLWWVVHSWAGFKLSIFLTFILATGTLAVFAHEFDWLVTPSMRVAPRDAPRASWGTIAEAARRAAPDARLTTIFAPIDPWFAVEAWAGPEKGAPRRVYVDPWTGKVTGQHGWANIHRFLRQVHRQLMLPAKIGIPIVCSLALLLAASLVTGIVTYKKWWRGFFRWPRTGDMRRLSGDIHRLSGLWSHWFVALHLADRYLVYGRDARRLLRGGRNRASTSVRFASRQSRV